MAGRRIGSSRSSFREFDTLAFVLDQMPVGVVLLDRDGCSVWMNWSAHQLVEAGAGIRLCEGRLVPESPDDAKELGRMVERAIGVSPSDSSRAPETIALQRLRNGRLVAVVRSVAPTAARRAAATARAVIYLSAGDSGLQASRSRLQQLFALTAHEAELVTLLAAGHSLRVAARHLGITDASARTYLKRVFAKTGSRRQGELIRLALATVPTGAGES